MNTLKLLAIFIPVFMVVDLLWLGVVMRNFYSAELGDLARRNGASLAPRWGAAILVYLLLPAGIVFLVNPLLSESTPMWKILGHGALYGLVVYGVYDLTNLATLEKYSLRLTIADMAWGCVLCGMMTVVMRAIAKWVGAV